MSVRRSTRNTSVPVRYVPKEYLKYQFSANERKHIWKSHVSVFNQKIYCPFCKLIGTRRDSIITFEPTRCGTDDYGFTLGHLIAEKLGGAHDAYNVYPMCVYCNSAMLSNDYSYLLNNKIVYITTEGYDVTNYERIPYYDESELEELLEEDSDSDLEELLDPDYQPSPSPSPDY